MSKYSNKIIPKQGKKYSVIVQLDREWEIIETIGIYQNNWMSEEGKPLVKVICWKEI